MTFAKNREMLLGLTSSDKIKIQNLDSRIVIGRLQTIQPHPDSKITKVRITQCDIGKNQIQQILCGGINIRPGIMVPIATLGAELSSDFIINQRTIRGETSHGMICARSELGISAEEEPKGAIWILPDFLESFLGTPLRNLPLA